MAKARVCLEKALSHECRGRVFVKGLPQVIDNDADIAYYKAQNEFTVTMLKELAPKPAPKPVPVPVIEDDEELEEVEEEEYAEPEPPAVTKFTAESLATMTKNELVILGQGPRFNLALDGQMKKQDLVEAILAQQSLEG